MTLVDRGDEIGDVDREQARRVAVVDSNGPTVGATVVDDDVELERGGVVLAWREGRMRAAFARAAGGPDAYAGQPQGELAP